MLSVCVCFGLSRCSHFLGRNRSKGGDEGCSLRVKDKRLRGARCIRKRGGLDSGIKTGGENAVILKSKLEMSGRYSFRSGLG